METNMNTMNTFNENSIEKLIQSCRDDKESLDMIYDIFKGFEEYHAKIVDMETKIKLYSTEVLEREEYQGMITELDRHRTMQHDSLLTGVNILNRMAQQAGLEPIYEGMVSKVRPFRREVANAVLDYLQNIITNRR